jgi:hypothetical protein
MAFLMTINGPGGAPEVDFGSTSKGCDTFNGTNLKNCPEIGYRSPFLHPKNVTEED